MDRLFHEALDEPSQPHNLVVFHQNNGAGDDDLTIPESQERYDDYFVTGTPNAQFDGGFRQVSGGESGEDANYQTYSQALADCYTRYEDNTLNPFDNNFKFVNLQVNQKFSGDGYQVSVKIEYLGSASDRPSLGILPINSPDLSGSLYVFMTEDNVTAWSSERGEGENVVNNAAFRGFALKDERFTLAREETYEIMGEWQFPEDPAIPIKPGDITAVAAVYDLDDTSSGRSEGGNPANVPRAIQSATPKSTAYDLGNDLPILEDITITYDGEAQISAQFEDENGISMAYVLYNTEAANATNWEYIEMEISGEELCDESGACYAYLDSQGLASIPMTEGEILYYQLLIYDGNSTEGKTGLATYKAAGGTSVAGGGSISFALILIVIGVLVLAGSFFYILQERKKSEVMEVEPEPIEDSLDVKAQSSIQSRTLGGKRPSKSMMLGAIILGIVLISVGAVASVLPSSRNEVTDITMIDVDGNEITLSDYRGKVVLLEFMATWCSDCRKLTKQLKDVYSHYGNDIVMISLDIDNEETPEMLKSYANDNGAKWTFAFPKNINNVMTTFNIHEIPKTLIIDKGGYLTFEFLLSQDSGDIINKIEATRQGAADPITSYSIPIEMLAFAAGIALFLSPCAFPMLPGYVAYYLGKEDKSMPGSKKEVIKKALPSGIAAASGILFVFLFSGTLIMLIGSPILPYIPLMAPFVAILLILLGVLMFTNIQYYSITNKFNSLIGSVISKIKFRNRSLADSVNENEIGGVFAYGMGYGLAAAGCTLPVFLLIITVALSTGGFLSGMFIFFIFALGMALFMFFVTLLVATSKDSIINKLKMSTHKIKMVSGFVMVGVGIAVLAGFYVSFMV
jgi:cytochrome c-type biogenesis protein